HMGGGTVLALFVLSLSIHSATACDRCVHQSKAAYSPSASALSVGACGYGSMALGFNGGYIAAGSSALHREGVGCGACFQVRDETDSLSNTTDLGISPRAFTAMARDGTAQELKKLGILDVEYKRIPCEYKKQNLSIRVEERSSKPGDHLVIKFLYQGGQTDIMAVDVAQVGSWNWRFMSREYGPVWSTSRAPAGPLQFRMVVTGGYDGKWVWAEKAVLPAEWKTGSMYDMGVQLTDIAQEGCYPCDTREWK
ncbi:hypothetical protein BHM03_00060747, partial [Ensete ventricosum]